MVVSSAPTVAPLPMAMPPSAFTVASAPTAVPSATSLMPVDADRMTSTPVLVNLFRPSATSLSGRTLSSSINAAVSIPISASVSGPAVRTPSASATSSPTVRSRSCSALLMDTS